MTKNKKKKKFPEAILDCYGIEVKGTFKKGKINFLPIHTQFGKNGIDWIGKW